MQPLSHLHKGNAKLFGRLQHVVGQLSQHACGGADEVELGGLVVHEQVVELLRHSVESPVARLQDVLTDLRWREGERDPSVLAGLVLQGLDKVPDDEKHLRRDLTLLTQQVHHPQHGLGPFEVALVQVKRHDGLVAEAVAEHRVGRGPAVAVGVAEELPGRRGALQGVQDPLADTLARLIVHGRVFSRPGPTGNEVKVLWDGWIVRGRLHGMLCDVKLVSEEPSCEHRPCLPSFGEELEDPSKDVFHPLLSIRSTYETLAEIALFR
mmetsp:Transcript_33218/g.45151  ORF Transcript_33218/g.45151 Transcript_33218/m.45151 type:complete len:266 (-) Transcript_33218:184-981(-)